MKIKVREAMALFDALNRVAVPASVAFNYASAINVNLLRPIVTAAQEAARVPDAVTSYEAAHKQLVNELAERDVDGRPIVVGENVRISDPEAFKLRAAELAQAHPDAQALIAKHNADVNRLLDELTDVDLKTVPLEAMPDRLVPALFARLMPMVEKPAPEPRRASHPLGVRP